MSRRPEDFAGVDSAISQRVVARQHGLRTRLLDITRNPLAARFHACKEDPASGGSSNGSSAFLISAFRDRFQEEQLSALNENIPVYRRN